MAASTLEALTVVELKSLLRSHGVSTTNYKKAQLLQLATFVRERGLEPDPDKQREESTAGFRRKLSDLGCAFQDPFTVSGFTRDLTHIPNFGLYDIFNYLLFNRTDYDRKKLKAYKSFEDYRLFSDGHVLDLQFNSIDDNSPYCLFKAQVKPTQRDVTYLKKSYYDSWFLLEKASADIKVAYCHCLGGADGACRHIAAALYALEAWEKKSVTDGPCQWKRRAMAHDQPVPISKLCIQDVKFGSKVLQEEENFDPRHPDDREPLSNEDQLAFIEGLFEILPAAAAVSLFEISKTTDSEDLSTANAPNTVSLSIMEKAKEFVKYHVADIDEREMCSQFVSSVVYSKEEIVHINNETVGQHENPNWHVMRRGLLTASNFHRICTRVKTIINIPSTDYSSTVDSLLNASTGNNSVDVSALKWGKAKEPIARRLYSRVERKIHKHLKVRVPGLQIFENVPFIGCSVDGVVKCDCHQLRLLEVKCPHSYRTKSPKEAAKAKGCVFNVSNNVWELSETSDYYAQIQGQLGIYELETCDLVIYTKHGITVIPVLFDKLFFQEMVNRLEFFYKFCVAPKIISSSMMSL